MTSEDVTLYPLSHENKHLRKTIEKLKEDLIKKGKKKYFITAA